MLNTLRIAGNENQDFAGDNGLAINATFNVPNSITIDKSDNIFVADSFNHRVRRIDAATSIITTVAGNGSPNFGSDGSPATNTGISSPDHVVIDSKNNLIIGENGSARIRKVDNNTKIVSTIAGNGFLGASGDGAAATKASITGFAGLAIDSSDNLYFSDFSSNIVRMVKGTNGSAPVSEFTISFNPNSLTVARGKSSQVTLNITRTGGFAGNVTVNTPDTKSIKVKISPATQSTTSATLNFSFKVKSKAPVGSQSLIFTGKDDSGRTRTATLNLVIQ